MRVWTRKSALIQPRTSLRESALSWPASRAPASAPHMRRVMAPTICSFCTHTRHCRSGRPPRPGILTKFCQNFRQIFVKFSSNFNEIFINFCIQYSIFQRFSKSTHFCKILQKILQIFAKILRISENLAKFCKIF